ncbi:MAG: AAA-like domain-containing protein, partial [Deltaproteobacteria bacterium]|nr:AAA-like domain-containing protein [Deltaproteobacteria bacterium]
MKSTEDTGVQFHPERPCENTAEHVGRKEILYHAYARLGTEDIQSFAVIGAFREGKSSLINYLQQPDVLDKYLPEHGGRYVFLCIDFKNEIISDPTEFFELFYQKAGRLLNLDGLKNMWDDLSCITEQLDKNDQKLITTFDNFNLLVTNPNFPVNFFEGLRSWFSTNRDVGCIVTSPLQLLNLAVPVELAGSPFFNIFDAYSLHPFSFSEAKQLIEERLPAELRERDKDLTRLINNFGFSPYPLHVAGKAWLTCFQQGT